MNPMGAGRFAAAVELLPSQSATSRASRKWLSGGRAMASERIGERSERKLLGRGAARQTRRGAKDRRISPAPVDADVVETKGIEPSTSALRTRPLSQLSYVPTGVNDSQTAPSHRNRVGRT